MSRLPLCIIAIGAVLLAGAAAQAAEAPVGGPAVTFAASDFTLAQTAAALTKSAGIPVVGDPESKVKVSASFTSTPLERVLDTLGKTAGFEWRKVFVRGSEGQGALAKEALDEARRQAAILKQIVPASAKEGGAPAAAGGAVLLYDPAAKTQVVVTVQQADSQKADDAAAALGLKPAYVLMAKESAPAASDAESGGASAQAYANLSAQQSHQFVQMSPQQRVEALQTSVESELTMSPQEVAAMTTARMQAYRALMESNSPVVERWRQQRREVWESLRSSGALPGRDGSRGRDRGGMMMGPGPGF